MRKIMMGAAAALTAALGLISADIPPAAAGMFATSESPYWQVGRISAELSRACQKGEFGQVRRHLFNIGFIGPDGKSLTGIANTKWNLYDPRGLAEPEHSYHFYNQGYSNCKVYVWPQPDLNQAQR